MRTCTTCGQRFSSEAAFCPFDGTKLESAAPGGPRRSDEIAGTIIGAHYRVDRVLGEGGMGIVYAVTHTRLDKRFALKLLKRELSRDPETRARFLLEARAAGQIRHPNVVEITDFSSLPDGSAYLVMEYLEGQSLARLIKLGGAIPALRAVAIIRDIASALQAAHDLGIVHRDLKPDNVFVIQHGGREVAKILDFGVAKVAGSAKLTRTGMVFGTPHYMSPEQASGGVVDGRTDVYALGVIMYEMFAGRVPFEADTYMGVLTKHMFEAPVPLSKVVESARQLGALEDVTLKALAKRPEDRYSSMNDLLADLDQIIRIGEGGHVSIAPRAEGVGKKLQRGPRADVALRFQNLADQLEPPTRAEVTAATANDRERRVRRIGVLVVGGVLIAGASLAVAASLGQRNPGRRDRGDHVTLATTTPPSLTPPAATAPEVPSPAPVPDTPVPTPGPTSAPEKPAPASPPTGTVPGQQHPTTGSKPSIKPKKPASGEAEDPWAK